MSAMDRLASLRADYAELRNLAMDLARTLDQLVDHEHDLSPRPDTGAMLRRARAAGLLVPRRQRTAGADA